MTIVVEREGSKLVFGGFRLVIFQTDAEGALKWHPRTATRDKIKFKTSLVFSGIPSDKVLDDALWAFVFKLPNASPAMLYDVILPYLCAAPLEEALAVNAEQDDTEWKTAQVPDPTLAAGCSLTPAEASTALVG